MEAQPRALKEARAREVAPVGLLERLDGRRVRAHGEREGLRDRGALEGDGVLARAELPALWQCIVRVWLV